MLSCEIAFGVSFILLAWAPAATLPGWTAGMTEHQRVAASRLRPIHRRARSPTWNTRCLRIESEVDRRPAHTVRRTPIRRDVLCPAASASGWFLCDHCE